MAKDKNTATDKPTAPTSDAQGTAAAAAEEEEDNQMVVDCDAATGLPITTDKDGNFIPKIPKRFFFGDHVKETVDGWEKKKAFLEYAVASLQYRLKEHMAIKDPEQAKKLKIAKLEAELKRLRGDA